MRDVSSPLHGSRQRACLRIFILGFLAAAQALDAQAQFLFLSPGGSGSLSGTTSQTNGIRAIVLADVLRPFSITNSSGSVVLSGNFQDRVSSNVGSFSPGTLEISFDVRDYVGPGTLYSESEGNYGGVTTRVNYFTDSVGNLGAQNAARSADGNIITFSSFSLVPGVGGGATVAHAVETDSTKYMFGGLVTLTASDGLGNLFST